LPSAFHLADEQDADWRRRWKKATRDAPITFDDALAVSREFLDPLLAGDVDGKVWDRVSRRWS
jgi:hypothetical protein